jgi:hypothetical protein
MREQDDADLFHSFGSFDRLGSRTFLSLLGHEGWHQARSAARGEIVLDLPLRHDLSMRLVAALCRIETYLAFSAANSKIF